MSMKSKPIVMDKLSLENDFFIVDFDLTNNIVLLTGEAGSGKTLVFNLLRQTIQGNEHISCFNYENDAATMKDYIRRSSGYLIVIDNADILLDDETRKLISLDARNQFLLIGRNPKNLLATRENIYEINREKFGKKIRFYIEPF